MTDKEKIITKIERIIEQLKEERSKIPSPTSETIITSLEVSLSMSSDRISLGARIAALEEILVFINSLPAEPSEDLEEAAKEYSGKSSHPLNNAFKDGAKWQKEQLINKACEWLVYNVNGSVYYDDFDNAFVDTDELITVFKEAMNND